MRLCVDQTETETEVEALEIEKSREIVVSEFELDLCIKRLHLCFVSVNDPSMIFISHLQPVIFILFFFNLNLFFEKNNYSNFFLGYFGSFRTALSNQFWSFPSEEFRGADCPTISEVVW